jgi:lysozyme family protein
MADFNQAISHVLENEGGLVDHPKDPGGVTKYGISFRFLSSLPEFIKITPQYIKDLTPDHAREIYKKYFWDAHQYAFIDNQSIATKVFDLCVNMGEYHAHKILQKAVNTTLMKAELAVDGKIGPKTIKATNDCDPHELNENICTFACLRYKEIVEKRPTSNVFLNGWFRRANKIYGDEHD